jgi:protease PrsW
MLFPSLVRWANPTKSAAFSPLQNSYGTITPSGLHYERHHGGIPSDALMQLTIFLPFFLIMALAVWRSGVWERRVIREELAGEVGRAVSPSEYQEIVGDRMLRTRRIDRTRPRASAALVNAQHELAFRKKRVRGEGKDPERDTLAAGWRDEIQRLRAV